MVVLFAAVMLVLQTPRVNRVIFQYDGLSAPYGRNRPLLTTAELAERARIQRQALAALDRIEQAARQRGIRRGENRLDNTGVNVIVPGMPTGLGGMGADELLDIPDSLSPAVDPSNSLTPEHRKQHTN